MTRHGSELPCISGAPWAGLRYFCTTRVGGVSRAPHDSLNLALHVDDQPDAVLQNRARLGRLLPAPPLWLQQVHGVRVVDAAQVPGTGTPCADAALTSRPARPLAILTADCLPVVIADDPATVVAVAHAGWRGLQAGVLENCVESLKQGVTDPGGRRWRAWIGPGIGPQAFEVGPEVRAAFVDADPQVAHCFVARSGSDRYLADLAAIAAHRLHRAGVQAVEASGHCTHRQTDLFYSYRRDGVTGRQATLAWLVAS